MGAQLSALNLLALQSTPSSVQCHVEGCATEALQISTLAQAGRQEQGALLAGLPGLAR